MLRTMQLHAKRGSQRMSTKVLTLASVNQKVVNAEYAVRGTLAIRAESLKQELIDNPSKYDFKNIVFCNIGNPQQLGQKPITFFRQVIALTEYPDLMNEENLETTLKIFPKDAIDRAKKYLEAIGGSTGAYSHSQGIPLVRKGVANFIMQRDGYSANPDDIFLTAGASSAVQGILEMIISDKNVGVMIPIPQYPLYTATITLKDGTAVPYYLDEANSWGMTTQELERAMKEMKSKNGEVDIKALCVINPGNPTGQCLTEEQMKSIVEFCFENKLVLLADEVYQRNIYSEIPFTSFKKVLKDMGPKYDSVELFSFHSISKGMIGECGRRGGYVECVNVDKDVKQLLYKVASVSLCPPVSGQLMVDLMTNPPKEGDESFELFKSEDGEIYGIYD